MKVAIHHRKGSFSERWIKYCHCFLWHYHHAHYKDAKAAKNVLFALLHAGIKTFPNYKTDWHFDDKIAQKYLLEAIDAPLVPSYIFYDKKEALNLINKTSSPKVFKLKGAAEGVNVRLANNRKSAIKLINRAFDKGFSQFDKFGNLKDSSNKYKEGRDTLISIGKGVGQLFITTNFSRQHPNEKGYAYFQDFVTNNSTDFRIKAEGNKAWGFQRTTRNNDFRASGNGKLIFDNIQIPIRMIEIAFKIAKQLDFLSVAYDFFVDEYNAPRVIEISYGFGIDDSEFDNGYWDKNINWCNDTFRPEYWIIENLIQEAS